jgi:thioredoxin 1
MSAEYLDPDFAPTRADVDRLRGHVLVEFGTDWCGFCRALQPDIKAALLEHPEVRHVKVEDGPGRPLGRSFRVKLWPNLVFMKDGVVVRQLARPGPAQLREAFEAFVQERDRAG